MTHFMNQGGHGVKQGTVECIRVQADFVGDQFFALPTDRSKEPRAMGVTGEVQDTPRKLTLKKSYIKVVKRRLVR